MLSLQPATTERLMSIMNPTIMRIVFSGRISARDPFILQPGCLETNIFFVNHFPKAYILPESRKNHKSKP
jgi:hypothetical protein